MFANELSTELCSLGRWHWRGQFFRSELKSTGSGIVVAPSTVLKRAKPRHFEPLLNRERGGNREKQALS